MDCHNPAETDRTRCKKHLEANAAGAQKWVNSEKGQESLKNREEKIKETQREFQKRKRRGKGRYSYVKGHLGRKKTPRDFTLTESEYYALIANPCEYCGLENDVEAGVGLDRLDNSKGYTLDNVVSCCKICNLTRADRFSVDEMKKIGQVVREIRLARDKDLVVGGFCSITPR